MARNIDWHDIDRDIWEKQIHQKYTQISSTPTWWENLEWIKGGKELAQTSKHLFDDVCILSSAGTNDPKRFAIIEEGKRLWIKKNMPYIKNNSVFIVSGKAFKKEYASKHSILVDDVAITIKEWNTSGGFGILHNSSNYKNTIETLIDIAAPINLGEIAKSLPIIRRTFGKMK